MTYKILDHALPAFSSRRRSVLRGATASSAALVAHWLLPAKAHAREIDPAGLFEGQGLGKGQEAALVDKVEEAALLAADQAIAAQSAGTFGVGGLLLDSKGRILQSMRNAVVREGLAFDTTAHGERQLVDWYFHMRSRGEKLPPPHEVICITSLDPCLMCTGSLLVAGFQVVVIAYDDFAGVNYDRTAAFSGLRGTGEKLRRQFSYVECAGATSYARAHTGAPLPKIFSEQKISERAHALNANLFRGNQNQVQASIRDAADPQMLKDPSKLAPEHPLARMLQAAYAPALSVRTNPSSPGPELIDLLQATSLQDKKNGGRGDAVLMLDAFGNVLMSLPGHLAASPIRTTLLETLRGYMAVRWKAFKAGIKDADLLLCHPKHATFVLLRCPNDSSEDLLSLGAYGGVTTGTQRRLRYIQRSTLDDSALLRYFESMPPLYKGSFAKFFPDQIVDSRLLAAFAAPISPPV